jgi:hypothetical protein
MNYYGPVLIAAYLGVSAAASAQQLFETNRITLSGRVGFNISAHFKGLSTLPPPSSTRTTPNGDRYNYDDGYVLVDNSGNFGGQTWYWGYDDSSRQISGNNIVLSRSTLNGNAGSAKAEDDPSYGAELLYSRLLFTKDKLRIGFEVAANFLNMSLTDNSALSASVTRTSYPFPFTPGTTPPDATPGEPYQGTKLGPGFVIGDTPGEPTVAVVPGATIDGHRKFDANLWGFRLGPYLEYPLNPSLKLSLSGGLAGAYVDADVSWNETVIINGVRGETLSGSGHTDPMCWGFYVGGSVAWQFAEHWGVLLGMQYQDLGKLNRSFGGRDVELDLSESIFATLGISYHF